MKKIKTGMLVDYKINPDDWGTGRVKEVIGNKAQVFWVGKQSEWWAPLKNLKPRK